jgi:prepilin-type N-terminal cleavage/methylation domain-containing protein
MPAVMQKSPSHWPRRSPCPTSQGFTLIEMLVALVVFGTGVLGAAALLVGALASTGHAAREDAATGLLADLHELQTAALADAPAITAWRQAVAAALPTPPDGAVMADVNADPPGGDIDARTSALRWGEPGQPTAASAQLRAIIMRAPPP